MRGSERILLQKTVLLPNAHILYRQQRAHSVWKKRFPQQCYLHCFSHPFNGPLSRTTRVGQYQKGKTNLDFTEVRDSEWQWHQLGHMQVYISLQTDNHASTPPLSFYRPDALPAAQPTASKHWRHITFTAFIQFKTLRINVPYKTYQRLLKMLHVFS